MSFRIIKKDELSSARAGVFDTDHGLIETPVFMPVGTSASIKAVHQRELREDLRPDIILGNTYHLYLRPGTDILKLAGGIHRFMNWSSPVLSDSGGYQVYSLSQNCKVDELGVTFKSHIDGSKHFLTPEDTIKIQRKIGADIIMAFDECPPYTSEFNYVKNSMNLTHRWLDRCINIHKNLPLEYEYKQFLFPIVQGGIFKDLRKFSADFVASKDAEGNAIGGLSVGEPDEYMYEMTEIVCNHLPTNKPRYLMGVGTPNNILENITLGVDMFDCVMPTRNARNGMLFTSEGTINIKNKKWEKDFSPIDNSNYCFVDYEYSKAYLRHLFTVNEILGKQIATLHNLSFYLWLLREARKHILDGNFIDWKNLMCSKMNNRL